MNYFVAMKTTSRTLVLPREILPPPQLGTRATGQAQGSSCSPIAQKLWNEMLSYLEYDQSAQHLLHDAV